MKKHEAVEEMERLGAKINDLHASAWNRALNPTLHGWPTSIVNAATIPVLSFASLGQMVGEAVVKQVSPEVIETVTGEKKTEK
jgi:hypothetical protein